MGGVGCRYTYLSRVSLGDFACFFLSGVLGRKDRREGLEGFDGWD